VGRRGRRGVLGHGDVRADSVERVLNLGLRRVHPGGDGGHADDQTDPLAITIAWRFRLLSSRRRYVRQNICADPSLLSVWRSLPARYSPQPRPASRDTLCAGT
jgi:hypothetical protein